MWIIAKCGKFLNRWKYQTTLSVSWDNCVRVKKQQLELDMKQVTSFELGEECDKAVYCHACVHAKVLQWCLTLCNRMDHSLQDSLSMGLPRQEYWSGLPCPPQGDLCNPGIEPVCLISPGLADRFFTTNAPHLVYLTSMQSTSYKMASWIYHKIESRLLVEISASSDTQLMPW